MTVTERLRSQIQVTKIIFLGRISLLTNKDSAKNPCLACSQRNSDLLDSKKDGWMEQLYIKALFGFCCPKGQQKARLSLPIPISTNKYEFWVTLSTYSSLQ